MLIHDSFSSIGVTMAIGRELVGGRRFRYVGRSRSLAEYRADLADSDRIGNAVRQLVELPWFLRNVGLKVLLSLGWGKSPGGSASTSRNGRTDIGRVKHPLTDRDR